MTGVELEVTAAVTENLLLNASLGILDDEIEEVVGGVLQSGSFAINSRA